MPRQFAPLTLAALAAAVASAFAPAARAQSLTLSPAVVTLAGSAGESVTHRLTLRNDSDLDLEFAMTARDVVVRDGARRFVAAGELADSIAATAVFTPPRVRVGARSRSTVTVTLTLPPGVRHRAVAVYFEGTSPVASGDRQAYLSLGTLFTFTLSDRLSVAAGPLVARPPSASANARLGATLTNDGDEPVVPSGVAAILDPAGRLVGKVPFAARRLLPGESVAFAGEFPGELASGSYRLVGTFDFAGRALTAVGALSVP